MRRKLPPQQRKPRAHIRVSLLDNPIKVTVEAAWVSGRRFLAAKKPDHTASDYELSPTNVVDMAKDLAARLVTVAIRAWEKSCAGEAPAIMIQVNAANEGLEGLQRKFRWEQLCHGVAHSAEERGLSISVADECQALHEKVNVPTHRRRLQDALHDFVLDWFQEPDANLLAHCEGKRANGEGCDQLTIAPTFVRDWLGKRGRPRHLLCSRCRVRKGRKASSKALGQ